MADFSTSETDTYFNFVTVFKEFNRFFNLNLNIVSVDIWRQTKFFNFDKYISTYYTYNGATTNYPDVFASELDMAGIQALIDEYLAERAYLEYNYSCTDHTDANENGKCDICQTSLATN